MQSKSIQIHQSSTSQSYSALCLTTQVSYGPESEHTTGTVNNAKKNSLNFFELVVDYFTHKTLTCVCRLEILSIQKKVKSINRY